MRPGTVVPLMFEAWEIDLGRHDVDLAALSAHGVRFAGTNERHPAVDVFSYLGPMAVKLLADVQKNAVYWPASPAGVQIQQALSDAINRVLTGQQTPQQSLAQAQKVVDSALADSGA